MRSSNVIVQTPGPTIGAPLMKMSINTTNLEDKFGEEPVSRRRGPGVNWKHVVYLVVMMCIGSGLLDVIINGGLAALLYHGAVRTIQHNFFPPPALDRSFLRT